MRKPSSSTGRNELNALGAIANIIRERKNGNVATYILNRYINYSNHLHSLVPVLRFRRAEARPARVRVYASPEIVQAVRDGLEEGITEVHMVGGLHPTLPEEWYIELLTSLRALDPASSSRPSPQSRFAISPSASSRCRSAKPWRCCARPVLTPSPAAARRFSIQGVRDKICRGKENADEWLEVHRTWHQMGERSTCTMLYGHVETVEQRVDHLRRLRELQDETGGFTGFIPFAFVPETTEMAHIKPASAFEELRNLAVSRIYLDNIDHITGYWVALGLPLAAVALNYGVDDLHGTIVVEKIFHMAGAKTPQRQHVETLEKAIREAGREPDAAQHLLRPCRARHP